MTHDRGRSKFITHAGETLSMSAWSRRLGPNADDATVSRRLLAGWSVERALTQPVAPMNQRKQARLQHILGLYRGGATTTSIGQEFGLPKASVCRILFEARTKWGYDVPVMPNSERGARRAAVIRQARAMEAIRSATAVLEAHRKPLGGLEAPPHHSPTDMA